MSDEAADGVRRDALARARVRLSVPHTPRLDLDVREPELTCRFIARQPTGTTPKFDCALADGTIVKIKYGRTPEVVAEVAATRLLSALGFAADRMSIAERVRCYGCPRHPFLAMRILQLTGTFALFPPQGSDDGVSEFTWVGVERRFDAPAIEAANRTGWGWWELKSIDPAQGASRTDLDALRLVAMFLAHWDNKEDNQRLVCLDSAPAEDAPCGRPLLMIQDLGATFGPTKANIRQWRTRPVWSDRASCTISMSAMPFHGGTFPDARVTERARQQIGRQLAAIGDDQVHALFAAARFAEFAGAPNADSYLGAWVTAFRSRVRQITDGDPCPQ